MTKKARIAELERRIEQLETELANLRGQPMLLYGRVPHGIEPMSIPDVEPGPGEPGPHYWDPHRPSTGDPLPEPPITTICNSGARHTVWVGSHIDLGFPSVAGPDGTIISLI